MHSNDFFVSSFYRACDVVSTVYAMHRVISHFCHSVLNAGRSIREKGVCPSVKRANYIHLYSP